MSKTYTDLLTDALNDIPDNVLKNEGSLIYNALSALAYELEKLYIQIDYLTEQTHADTADIDELVKIAADRGITRKAASAAVVKIEADAELPTGARFSLKSYNYAVTKFIEQVDDKYYYQAECETTGSGPNTLTGDLTPITYVDGLTKATITEILVDGEDDETRDSLYLRYLESFETAAFGGNITQYKEQVNAVSGVGGCKVYPVWNGAGTVKVVPISASYRACSDTLISNIQNLLQPEDEASGYGLAPIDHTVTVESVSELTVNVSTAITFKSGHSYETLKETIEATAAEFMTDLSKTWSEGDETEGLTVYIARFEAAMLDIQGILDINNTAFNGTSANLTLNWNQIPVIGEVTVS